MQKLEFELEFTELTEKENTCPAIILAAGSSSRMNGINKPFAEILGLPVIVRTLLQFQNSKNISKIILVTKKEFIKDMQNFCEEYSISKVSDIVEGGENRQESVLNGLKYVKEEKVLIHDGARPLVTKKLLENIVLELQKNQAVICAVKAKDTIKNVDKNGFVNKTYNRDELYLVQTPQGADTNKYLEILNNVDTSKFTDDASVLESANIPVKVVDGEYFNIKITTPDDLALAEFYLSKLGENL